MARLLVFRPPLVALAACLALLVGLPVAVPSAAVAQDTTEADTLDAAAPSDSVRAVQRAEALKADADSLLRDRQIDAAIDVYRQALAANEGLARPRFHIRTSYNLARALDDAGRPDEALTILRPLLDRARELEWDPALARILSTTATMHRKMGAYDEALPLYDQALTVNRRLNRPFGLSVNHTNTGNVYFRQGKFSQALASYEAALRTAKEADRPRQVALSLNNIGALYSHLGQREEALDVHLRALRFNRANDLPSAIASSYTNVGTLLARIGRTEDALRVLQESLDLHEQIGRSYDIEVTRMDVGSVKQMMGQYDDARAAFAQSLQGFRQIQRPDGVGDALINLGGLEATMGRYDAALRHYEDALSTFRRVEERPGEASALKGIGFVELDRGNAAAAIPPLDEAVSILESLRLNTTSPETRRSYQDSQIEAYRGLTLAHVRAGDARKALYVAEQSRARLLAERLARTSAPPSVAPVDSLQQTIDPGTAAVVYANTASDTSAVAFVVTPTRVEAVLLPAVPDPEPTHPAVDTVLARFVGGFSDRALRAARPEEQGEQSALAKTLQQYRKTLVAPTHRLRTTRPALTDSILAQRERLGRRLYDALVAPVRDAVGPESSLLIVPDGVLGFLPFETLRTPEGRYLIEDRHVRYAQSLNVLHLLQRRQAPVHRRDLLAFGGVTYNGTPPARPLQRRGSRLDSLLAAARDTAVAPSSSPLTKDDSLLVQTVRSAVGGGSETWRTGTTTWGTLPGTDTEVRLLQRAVPDADVFVRGAASERTVRRMSKTGQLRAYRWIHFATHGFVDPETPDLSALVLAGDRSGDDTADGYLTMQEIAALDLSADVVTLSACQTGVGRLYGGEGVVSLAHAVFRAGARGTTVSLWNVVDGTTSDFMKRVYRRARLPGTSFAEAVTQAKRDFLRDPTRDAPLLWAPFVYYGP